MEKFQSNSENTAEPFANEEMNQEVKDMITLGLLDQNWARGLNKSEAEAKFNQVLSSGQNVQVEPFENEEMNQEVRDMISLGVLDQNWAHGLNKSEAEAKFNQVLSSGQNVQVEPFENEEMNQEVRDMISLGVLDQNWAHGLNKSEAEAKFNQVLSSGQNVQMGPFENEEMNQEVRDMISLGVLDQNWAHGLNKSEAEAKFNQVLSSGQNSATRTTNVCPGKKADTKKKKKKQYKVISLCPGDQAYKDIFKDFKNCNIAKDIKTIQLVENEKQKKSFQEEINQVKNLLGNEFDLQIKQLYHATKASKNLICSRGLDQRLSTVGCFGRGIYFADDVKKCEKYLYNVKGSAIYRCSVILGDIKEYPNGIADPNLKQEPEKENGDYYDSVKGNMDGYNEYVIYDNRRCLINYRIVLEGTEDEESDREDEIEAEEKKEELMQTWKRHMHFLVDSCKHDDEDDAETEQEIRNIEKIRLEIRRRREIKTGKHLTQVSYELLREERKKWRSYISKTENKSQMPSNLEEEEKSDIASQSGSNIDNFRQEFTKIDYPQNEDPEIAEDVQRVFDSVLSEFLNVTGCEDMELARFIITNQNQQLDKAVNEYVTMLL